MIWGKGKQKLENSTPAAPKIVLVCTNNKQSMFEMTIVHDCQMWRRRREANKRHNLQITTVMNFDLLKNYVRKRYRQTDRQIDGRTAAKTARLRPVNSKIKPRYTTNKQHSLHLLQISQPATTSSQIKTTESQSLSTERTPSAGCPSIWPHNDRWTLSQKTSFKWGRLVFLDMFVWWWWWLPDVRLTTLVSTAKAILVWCKFSCGEGGGIMIAQVAIKGCSKCWCDKKLRSEISFRNMYIIV